MKQIKLTFWLLGFGCGIILSGVIGAICTLNVQEYKKDVTVVGALESADTTSEKEQAKSQDEKAEEYKTEKYEEDAEVKVVENPEDNLQVVDNNPPTKIEVYIPSNSGATEIAKILEGANIIEDSKAFVDYVKQNKKTTKLKDGKVSISKNASYEEILAILVNN